jgi:dolichol-phosphate mannosyltransferase
MNPSTIAIIIPVYNESENIEKNLDAIQQGITGSQDTIKVHIVYDLDQDTTLPVIAKIRAKYSFPIELIKNPSGGVCNAIKTGLDQAKAEFLLVTMADMSDDYSILTRMVDRAKSGFDIVCGSRYMSGGKTYGGPWLKQNLSRWAGLSLHYFTHIPTHDITNSYKLYRRSFLDKITIESEGGFEIGMEITAKAFIHGYKIAEIPARSWDRTAGQSRFRLLHWLPKYLRWYGLLIFNRRTHGQ